MLLLRIFLPFALGYFLSFLFRSINAVVGPRLVEDVGIGPESLGLLTSIYFLTFAAIQIPLGVALDRFGPRRTEAFLLLFAALGAFLFAQAETTEGLIVARGLIGLGVAACLMASFKVFVLWFPHDRLPLLNGCMLAVGGFGAIMATTPVELALGIANWRSLFVGLAGLTFIASALIFLAAPEKPGSRTQETIAAGLGGVRQVFASRLFWRIGPMVFALSAAGQSFQGLWAGPWLRDIGGYSPATTANMLMVFAIAMTAGFLSFGAMTQGLIRRGNDPLKLAVCGVSVAVATQTILVLNATELAWPLMATMGFFGTSAMLVYAALVPAYPVHLSGRVSTAMNLMAFVGAFAGQWVTGLIIGLFSAPGAGFAPVGYQTAFALLMAIEVAAVLWLASSLTWRRGRAAA